MAPKMKPKLDRAQLEVASAERIDAITADTLHPTKFVEIVSPDGKLRLFYNTSTLIRIGLEKGHMMQPPHFREPMKPDLLRIIEQLEGRQIVFEERRQESVIDVDGVQLAEIVHRHMHFQQIVDEFFLLNPAQVFVCPRCYERWITQSGWTPLVDPLDALSEIDDERLGMMVFRYARDFKRHLATHHWIEDDANDHRLRDVLCTYFSNFNEAHPRDKLTLQLYWIISARYNVVRYNRVVDVAVAAQLRGDPWQQCAFPDPVGDEPKVKKTVQGVSDTFVDDDEFESDGEWVPMYDGCNDEEDESQSDSSHDRKRKRDASSEDDDDEETSTADEDSSEVDMETDSEDEVDGEHTGRTGYLRPHPVSDKRNFMEKEYVQREMEKIHRREAREVFHSSLRRPSTRATLTESPEDWGAFVNGGPSDDKPATQNTKNPVLLLDDDDE